MRSNVKKVMADAVEIARRLRKTNVTQKKLMKKYHCTYSTIMRAVLSQIPQQEWEQIRKKKLAQGGVENRFKKEHIPWNKGLKGLHFSPATQFKKGRIPSNGKPLGTVTIVKNKDGRMRKIATLGPTPYRHIWVPYARWIWEQQHGPVPEGYLIVHEDGNRLNDDPNNLVLVDCRGNLALIRKNNPGWKKKAIRSYKKTVRIRRIRKAKAAKEVAKIREHELKLQQRARQLAEVEAIEKRKAEAEFTKLHGPVSMWWECAECGYIFEGELPWKCPKCQGLRFVKIKQHKKEAI